MVVMGGDTSGLSFERARLMIFTRGVHLLAATAAFIHGAFNFFLGLAGALLDASNQFILLALDELQIVIGELRKFLFQPALGDVPVPFDD